ncbi:response regulator transcription factor [Ammoniphilus sp. CFH 90114]|uniref:response regulator transcription factor n=1 Tax=Ammoniphilus sp. CFH 90114 TaxID=2493665 RepID=UPI00100DA654|nr:response regulator transcription factor [Ammoniphilus sp. CFH 90114]RXT06487.1 response regulator transcription factor [Ammoniphilus sp. CFH 90114]
MENKILLIEDDADIAGLIEIYLRKSGYEVVQTDHVEEAILLYDSEHPDLIISDIQLPGKLSGYDLCKIIRDKSQTPFIFISCKGEIEEIIDGIELGADDYLPKPFDPLELMVRVKARLRYKTKKELLKFDQLEINLNNLQVKKDGNEIVLARKEREILLLLCQNPNKVFESEEIYKHVWKQDSMGDYRSLLVHISNLRKKIENDPNHPVYIKTIRGVGYQFETPSGGN